MLRYIFYQLLWGMLGYVLRNPHARKAVGLGCLGVVLLITVPMLLSVLFGALSTLFIQQPGLAAIFVVALLALGVTWFVNRSPEARERLRTLFRRRYARTPTYGDSSSADDGLTATEPVTIRILAPPDEATGRYASPQDATSQTAASVSEADVLDAIIIRQEG